MIIPTIVQRETAAARRMIAASANGDEHSPSWVVARLAGLEPCMYCELPITPAVLAIGGMMIGKDGLECSTTSDGCLKFLRRDTKSPPAASAGGRSTTLGPSEARQADPKTAGGAATTARSFTDTGDGLGLPLLKFGPGGDFTREVRP